MTPGLFAAAELEPVDGFLDCGWSQVPNRNMPEPPNQIIRELAVSLQGLGPAAQRAMVVQPVFEILGQRTSIALARFSRINSNRVISAAQQPSRNQRAGPRNDCAPVLRQSGSSISP